MKNIAAKMFKIDKNSCALAPASWSGRSNFPWLNVVGSKSRTSNVLLR